MSEPVFRKLRDAYLEDLKLSDIQEYCKNILKAGGCTKCKFAVNNSCPFKQLRNCVPADWKFYSDGTKSKFYDGLSMSLCCDDWRPGDCDSCPITDCISNARYNGTEGQYRRR